MLLTVSILILAFAVSLDSFTVGFTYGLRNLHLPFRSLLIIACCTATSLTFALTVGSLSMKFFSVGIAEHVGGIMLILIGLFVILQSIRSDEKLLKQEKQLINFEIKSLGIVINILKKPLSADFDKSGTITGIEALFLGVALSLDAFAVGVSAALLRYSPIPLIVSVTIMSSVLVLLGINSGKLFSKHKWVRKLSILPGILLIFIGLFKL